MKMKLKANDAKELTLHLACKHTDEMFPVQQLEYLMRSSFAFPESTDASIVFFEGKQGAETDRILLEPMKIHNFTIFGFKKYMSDVAWKGNLFVKLFHPIVGIGSGIIVDEVAAVRPSTISPTPTVEEAQPAIVPLLLEVDDDDDDDVIVPPSSIQKSSERRPHENNNANHHIGEENILDDGDSQLLGKSSWNIIKSSSSYYYIHHNIISIMHLLFPILHCYN
jgi:hypothetical protein